MINTFLDWAQQQPNGEIPVTFCGAQEHHIDGFGNSVDRLIRTAARLGSEPDTHLAAGQLRLAQVLDAASQRQDL